MSKRTNNSENRIIKIIIGLLYSSSLIISGLVAFFPIQTIAEFIGHIVVWSFSVIIGATVWSSLSQMGVKKASDRTIRSRGRFIPKKYENLLLATIILFCGAFGFLLSVIGVPQEITGIILLELERSGMIQSIKLLALLIFILLVVIPVIAIYFRNQRRGRGTITTITQRPTKKRKERASKNISKKLGRR